MPNGTQQRFEPYVLLDEQWRDVTGGGRPDLVRLIGHRTDPERVYYEHVYVQVFPNAERTARPPSIPGQPSTPSAQQPLSIRFAGGYEPKMQFCDFSGDSIADVYVSMATGGSGGIGDFYLATFAGNVARQLPVPPPLTISGRFLDDYKVLIEVKETGQKTVIDVSDKKAQYDSEGLYRNGKLLKPTTILPNAYSTLEPIDRNRNGVCELRGIQRIAGAYNADTIAYVISVWGYERVRRRWALLRSIIREN